MAFPIPNARWFGLPERLSNIVFSALGALALASSYAQTQRSGFEDMGSSIQALQKDDSQNPATLWVRAGEKAWSEACTSCHGDAKVSMKGVAAKFPKLVAPHGVRTLSQQINACRSRQGQAPLGSDAQAMLQLASYIGLQSRGMHITPDLSLEARTMQGKGLALFQQRLGQLDLSCQHCHTERAGLRLAGNLIPQGHPNGYPIYRLEWSNQGSLFRRLRNCLTGVRAQPFDDFGAEAVALEAYLFRRAEGMPMETPGVRP